MLPGNELHLKDISSLVSFTMLKTILGLGIEQPITHNREGCFTSLFLRQAGSVSRKKRYCWKKRARVTLVGQFRQSNSWTMLETKALLKYQVWTSLKDHFWRLKLNWG